jgi:hypothetical protein
MTGIGSSGKEKFGGLTHRGDCLVDLVLSRHLSAKSGWDLGTRRWRLASSATLERVVPEM